MFLKYNFFTVIWMGVIMLLTLVSKHGSANVEYPHFDKVIHFALFCVLAFFMIIGFNKQDTYSRLRFYANRYAIILSTCYGLMIELVQLLVPGRDFDWFDLASDGVGSVVGYYVFVLVYRVL